MKVLTVEGTSIQDTWFRLLYAAVDAGRVFTIDRGSYAGQRRLELDFVVARIAQPWLLPLAPIMPEGSNIPAPFDEAYLADYVPYLMTGTLKPGESYTYGQRLRDAPVRGDMWNATRDFTTRNLFIDGLRDPERVPGVNMGVPPLLDQVALLIHTYKTHGYRNNQMVLQVAQPTDMLLKDPPCLRHIDTRIQDGQLHFFPYFRSWDLYGGFPANLAAIEILKNYCADEIGVGNGEIIASSKGLHLYDHVWELAETLRGKKIAATHEEKLSEEARRGLEAGIADVKAGRVRTLDPSELEDD